MLCAIWCVSMSLRRFGSRGVPKSSQVTMRVMVVICVNGAGDVAIAPEARRMGWTVSGKEGGGKAANRSVALLERERHVSRPHPPTHRCPSWLHRARERVRESWPKRRFDSVPRRAFSPNSGSVDLTPLSVARRSQPKKMQNHTAIFPSTAPTRPDEDLPDPASSTPHILATAPPLFLRSVRSTAS